MIILILLCAALFFLLIIMGDTAKETGGETRTFTAVPAVMRQVRADPSDNLFL